MDKKIISYRSEENKLKINQNSDKFTQDDAIKEFEELKKIALNCFDKNGNPNIQAAIKAVENKAKIAGLYKTDNFEVGTVVKMGEITINGEQLKLDIGEDFYK